MNTSPSNDYNSQSYLNNVIPLTSLGGASFSVPRNALNELPAEVEGVDYILATPDGEMKVRVSPGQDEYGFEGLSFKFHPGTEQETKIFIDNTTREGLLKNQMPDHTDFSVKYKVSEESLEKIKETLVQKLGFRPSALGVHQLDVYCSSGPGSTLNKSSLPGVGYKYRTPSSVVRIREEGGRFLVSEKDPLATHSHSSEWQRSDVEVSEDQVKTVTGSMKEIARVEKTRDIYLDRDGNIVCLDDVVHHGHFLEIRGNANKSLKRIADSLAVSLTDRAPDAYLDMSLKAAFPSWKIRIMKFHRKFGELVQGVVSGTLTPLGFLTTAAVVDPSFKNLFSALCAAAVCDGAGDSLAVAKAARSELNGSWADAIGIGLKTFAGKVVMPTTFLPIALYSPPHLIPVLSVAWASIILGVISAEQAIATARSVREEVLFTVIGALGVTGASVGVGTLIEKFLR